MRKFRLLRFPGRTVRKGKSRLLGCQMEKWSDFLSLPDRVFLHTYVVVPLFQFSVHIWGMFGSVWREDPEGFLSEVWSEWLSDKCMFYASGNVCRLFG